MGYIGNQQTQGFSQVPAKQDLTGATGTSLTLTHAVASAEGIDLFINNVRQEPTTAYSVGGDGVTVTLTGSVVATDDIYVVYNSLALQTTVTPDASVSTAKIIDGSVTSAKLDTNISVSGDLTVDTSTLHVDSTNNLVGIGTASPSSFYNLADNLVVGTGSGGNGMTIYSGSADSGYIGFNDTASASMQGFIQYNHNGDYMAFAPNGSEKMRLTSTGRLGINYTNPNFPLVVQGNATNHVSAFYVATNGYAAALFYDASNTFSGQISVGSGGTAYQTSSDYRLKTAVNYDFDATTRLKQLRPARFQWIADGDDAVSVDGFLAHEVSDIVPEAISGTKDAVDDEGNPAYQCIDQSKLVPLLVKTIQELEARITALETN